jgi:hypothetical protein
MRYLSCPGQCRAVIRKNLLSQRILLSSAATGSRTEASLPIAPKFIEYRESKLQYLQALASAGAGAGPLRLDCMKPQSALAHLVLPLPLFAQPFPASPESAAINLTKQWCELSGHSRADIVLTKGVRDSIFILLSSLADTCDEVVWPCDVYPVYEKLIQKTMPNAKFVQFDTLREFTLNAEMLDSLSSRAVLILPFPLTPRGALLGPEQVQLLADWLAAGPARRVVFDCVYSYDMRADCRCLEPLRGGGQAALAFSLAKSWASPFLEPISLPAPASEAGSAASASASIPTAPVPRESFSRGVGFIDIMDSAWRRRVHSLCAAYCMRPSQFAVCKAAWLLEQQPHLPAVFQERFREQWRRLLPAVRAVKPDFELPPSGYFATLPLSYVELLQRSAPSICAVPASVFGSGDAGVSVVSCLYDVKDYDNASGDTSKWLQKSMDNTTSGTRGGGATLPVPGSERDADMYHVTTLSNFIKGYDKYSRAYSKENISQSTFPDKFFLLLESQLQTGVDKASGLLARLGLRGDALLVLHTAARASQCIPHPRGQYLERNWVSVTGLSLLRPGAEGFQRVSVEEAAALSLTVNKAHLLPYTELKPRTLSILPIAKGCQARCPFCFSKGSVSNDLAQKLIPAEVVAAVVSKARAAGAHRAVITGGGEPMMLPLPRLLALLRQCAVFDTVCMITNGYFLSQLSEEKREEALLQLDASGLTVLSVSRHATTEEDNEKIMYLNTESAKVASTWARMHSERRFSRLTRMRWVCVLQGGGVDSEGALEGYLDFAAGSGVPEVCFKELYVSTSAESLYHDAASNAWSQEHQVPLSIVLNFCKQNGFQQIASLPWGAPVFEGAWRGSTLRIAAYTEPSVFWERSRGECRSWNLMADRSVLASLEDGQSAVQYDV